MTNQQTTTEPTLELPKQITARICRCGVIALGSNACPHCGAGWAQVKVPLTTFSRVSASVAPVVDKAHYEMAHDARYQMTHPVHPDMVVLWFLALKSHWFDDPANMFYGQHEQAKAYLYKWVETGELADDHTTLEIATAMKFREWLAASWVAAPASTVAPQEQSDAPTRQYFCSCGATCTAEEYIEHYFEKGHDRGEPVSTEGEDTK